MHVCRRTADLNGGESRDFGWAGTYLGSAALMQGFADTRVTGTLLHPFGEAFRPSGP